MRPRPLPLPVWILLAGTTAQAGPIALAIDGLEDQFLDVLHQAAVVVGPLLMLVGGGRAAWIAYRGEEWVGPFIQAIVGTAIFAGAT